MRASKLRKALGADTLATVPGRGYRLELNALLLVVSSSMTIDVAILVPAPVSEAYGYDKALFGIVMILSLEIGFLTPPVGINLIVASARSRSRPAIRAGARRSRRWPRRGG